MPCWPFRACFSIHNIPWGNCERKCHQPLLWTCCCGIRKCTCLALHEKSSTFTAGFSCANWCWGFIFSLSFRCFQDLPGVWKIFRPSKGTVYGCPQYFKVLHTGSFRLHNSRCAVRNWDTLFPTYIRHRCIFCMRGLTSLDFRFQCAIWQGIFTFTTLATILASIYMMCHLILRIKNL